MDNDNEITQADLDEWERVAKEIESQQGEPFDPFLDVNGEPFQHICY